METKQDEKQDKTKPKADAILEIALKRGFFYPAAEIYGGKAGLYFYGSIGKLLKLNFESVWRKFFLSLHDNFHEIEGTAILPEIVFKASGHLEHFNDPLVECKKCKFRFRADQFIEDKLNVNAAKLTAEEMTKLIMKHNLTCPKCSGKLSEVRWFNMMFNIKLGALQEDNAYLTPETAQLAYLAFKREFEVHRKKLPLGLAIIGKVFRNEISPRQLFFRLREFTQAELQVFIDEAMLETADFIDWNRINKAKLYVLLVDSKKVEEKTLAELNRLGLPKLYLFFMLKMQEFYLDLLKVPKEKFRFRELSKEERAFYNKLHFDVELQLDTLKGFKEVAGLHYRTNYDLANHEKLSKQNLHVFFNNKTILPHVIELSFGVDRNIYAMLDIFYKYDADAQRNVFTFPYCLCPYTAAVFPLVNRDGMPEKARQVYNLVKQQFKCFYDASGSIGRRYRRQDEIGTAFCITVDGQTLQDDTVTVRHRDTMEQERVPVNNLLTYLKEKLEKH